MSPGRYMFIPFLRTTSQMSQTKIDPKNALKKTDGTKKLLQNSFESK